jgi:hypothetical protein
VLIIVVIFAVVILTGGDDDGTPEPDVTISEEAAGIPWTPSDGVTDALVRPAT